MKYIVLTFIFFAGYLAATFVNSTTAADPKPAPTPTELLDKLANSSIDMPGYLKVAQEAERHRRTRRVTEEEFIKMSGEKDTIILDARSKQMFDLMHVKGAINLNFSDIDVVNLAKVLPDKNVRILIYCNNNFTPAADVNARQATNQKPAVKDIAFQPKKATASLNVSTYTALYNYGYKNVYELAPLLDPDTTKIKFESTPRK